MSDRQKTNNIGTALRRLMATPESPTAIFGIMDLALQHELTDLELWFREFGLTDEQFEVVSDIIRCGQPPTSWNGCRP